MKIGILTGGGDVPGLNPSIKAVVNRAVDAGHEVVGIRRGWGGLLMVNRDDPQTIEEYLIPCLLYTSPSPRDRTRSRMPSSA